MIKRFMFGPSYKADGRLISGEKDKTEKNKKQKQAECWRNSPLISEESGQSTCCSLACHRWTATVIKND